MIRKIILGSVLGLALVPLAGGAAEKLKPFVLASTTSGDLQAVIDSTKEALTDAGFEVVGEYTPYERELWQAHVIVATNDALKQAASQTDMGGFAAAQRIAVTQSGEGDVQVSYANPEYIANAYRLETDLADVSADLGEALGQEQAYNSEGGLSSDELREYHYMFGMEYFDDPYELASYDSYEQAVQTVETNLKEGVGGSQFVYRIDIPGKQQTVFGVGRDTVEAGGDKYADDEFIMSVVDFRDLKGTAYLPYEVMVNGDQALALHMRFRMAVHYPDLGMMGENSFMKIMPSPKANKKLFMQVAGQGEEF